MSKRSIAFVQLPLVLKAERTAEEGAYYDAYWRAMGRAFEHEFPGAEAYSILEIPLWITRLSAVARRAGWDPSFVDLATHAGSIDHMPVAQMAEAVCSSAPRVICMSPFTSGYEVAVALAKAIRQRHPTAILVLGGAHASALPRECIGDGFDVVVIGRGEAPLDHLLGELARGSLRPNGFPGLLTASSRNVAHEDRRLFETFLDTLSDYDIIDSGYKMSYARAYATLGCPYRCSFCADTVWNGLKPYRRDLGVLAHEVSSVVGRFDPGVLFIGDQIFTLDETYCRDVVELLGDIHVPWFCQTRADLLTRPADHGLLRRMAEGGCRLVNVGAENADESVLRGLGKRTDGSHLRRACQTVKEAGMSVLTYWMVGGPGETRATAGRTIETMCTLLEHGWTDVVDYFICTPYPGTDLFNDPHRYGVSIRRGAWREWREDSPSVLSTPNLTATETYEIWLSGLRTISNAMNSRERHFFTERAT